MTTIRLRHVHFLLASYWRQAHAIRRSSRIAIVITALPVSVCLSVCLSACLSVCLSVCLCVRLLKKIWLDFDEIFYRSGAWPREGPISRCLVEMQITIRILESFKGLFIYYHLSCRQPWINFKIFGRGLNSLSASGYRYYFFKPGGLLLLLLIITTIIKHFWTFIPPPGGCNEGSKMFNNNDIFLSVIFGPGPKTILCCSCCCYQFSKNPQGFLNTQHSATKLCICAHILLCMNIHYYAPRLALTGRLQCTLIIGN